MSMSEGRRVFDEAVYGQDGRTEADRVDEVVGRLRADAEQALPELGSLVGVVALFVFDQGASVTVRGSVSNRTEDAEMGAELVRMERRALTQVMNEAAAKARRAA